MNKNKEMGEALIDLIRETVGNPGMGAEIGVYQGHTGTKLVKAFPKCKMIFVDPWQEWQEGADKNRRTGKHTQIQWDFYCKRAKKNILKVQSKDQIEIYRETSLKAVDRFVDGSFDFVFIDSCFFRDDMERDITRDITIWQSKICEGGLLCGRKYDAVDYEDEKAVNVCLDEDRIIKANKLIWGYIV